MYFPTHRRQLTGIVTAAFDCGVRATQEGIDWLSKGAVVPSVAKIRRIMDDQDETNYHQWDLVIDELGGDTLGFSGERTNVWARVRDHMNGGGAVILAVDYGKYRRSLPSKSGSLTFDGYHAICFVGSRVRSRERQWRSGDSLLDGRYKGCPNGWVWVPQQKVKLAALEVGRREGAGDSVYAVLLHRDPSVGGLEPGDLIPDAGTNLSDVLSDLRDTAGSTSDARTKAALTETIEELEDLIGVSSNPEADADTSVESGVKV